MAKGDRYERELVHRALEEGYHPMRSPSSGAATSTPLPDVVFRAGYHAQPVAAEAKYDSGDRIYIPREEAAALMTFSFKFGAVPAIAPRFSGDTTRYFMPLDTAERTTEGYSIAVYRRDVDDYITFDNIGELNSQMSPLHMEMVCPRCGASDEDRIIMGGQAIAFGHSRLCYRCLEELKSRHLHG